MNNISQVLKCSGCGACGQICPVGAIRMELDTFYRPVVNNTVCLNCGKCTDICPVNSPMEKSVPYSGWYGAHGVHSVVKNSSSGGAFTAIAEHVLSLGGVVYGAAFGEGCRSVYITDTDKVNLDTLRKSKYVQSSTGDSFTEVLLHLEQGRQVLYCGAPCQIAGLKRFLGKPFEGLVTCDFTCGGMPSPVLYHDYLNGLEKKYGAEAVNVDFRPKTLGWENYAIKVVFSNGRIYHAPAKLDPFFHSFVYTHYNVGELCLECPFSDSHCADITLADFWRYRDFTSVKHSEGLSLVLAFSEKGDNLLRAVSSALDLKPLEILDATYNIRAASCTAEHRMARDMFFRDCKNEGIWAAAKKYGLPSGKEAAVVRLKSLMRYIRKRVK